MIRAYRKRWIKRHQKYENKARIIFQKAFKEIALKIPFNEIKEDNYTVFTDFFISEKEITKAFEKVYLEIGVNHGLIVGKEINKQIKQKDFITDVFLDTFKNGLISWLFQNGGQRIETVRYTFIEYINGVIARGFDEGKTVRQISTDIYKIINSRNFYKWQSLRIARTETTTAANYAATVSSSVSGVLMDKVWVSGQDLRTRRVPEDKYDHYHMNQVKVNLEKPFSVSGEKLLYPGDPKGSAGNVINCRCTVAQVVRRDKNGKIMRST